MNRLLYISIVSVFFYSCGDEKKPEVEFKSKKEYREVMINSHKAYLEKEREKLDEFEKQFDLDFQRTGSGLRYAIYQTNSSTDSIQKGDIAVVNYTLTLLNGDTAYQTLKDQPQEFIVALDDVEPGLHEGIQKLAIGDKAIFILPAHLAHGVSGDQSAIPPQSPLVYDVELLTRK